MLNIYQVHRETINKIQITCIMYFFFLKKKKNMYNVFIMQINVTRPNNAYNHIKLFCPLSVLT